MRPARSLRSESYPDTGEQTRSDFGRDRLLVARKWAYMLNTTAYIPLPYQEIEDQLLGMVRRLFDALLGEPFDAAVARDVGTELVGINCVGQNVVQRTVDLLGRALLGQPELRHVRRLPDRVVSLVGTFAAGYVDAVRQVTLDQQEDLNRTMMSIGRESRRGQRAAEARLTALLNSASTGIAIVDADGAFLRTNHALGSILDHSPSEFAELTVFDLLSGEDEIYVRAARDQLLDGSLPRMHQRRRMLTKSGDTVPVTMTATRLDDQLDAQRLVLMVQDDSELRLLQSQLTRQSLHDVVTGLPNRQYFTTRLETALHKADPQFGVTIYHLDLDSFALIADGLGRQAGDKVLKVVADRLKTIAAGEKAMVARLDSDEFAIVIENGPHTPDVTAVIDKINAELAQSIYVDNQNVTVSASIGVVHRPRGDVDPTELLRASDLALRRAKRHGRRQWELFDAGQDEQDRSRFKLATLMPSAWELGDVRLEYRPQVDLVSGAAVALEPVLRWDHPPFGTLGHRQCVELAEETGLMLSLGDWLLHSACVQVRGWSRELPLTIELSDGQAVDPDLVGRVLRILDEDEMPADQVQLGVPVRLLGGDRPEPVDHLRVLREAGVGVTLHGFTGAATDLPWLEDLPVTAVRLGEQVAAGQAERAASGSGALLDAMLTDMIATVHRAGGTVAVEGVDTAEQADWWREAGADTALGNHFTW